MFYLVRTPWLLKKYYPQCTWTIPGEEKILYLSFDDGPHPEATSFVLDQLKKYKARASFFCIGKNVVEYPQVYKRILDEGHRVGNHTHNHLNGWKTDDASYFDNILEAARYIDSDLFRPPYGKITKFQINQLRDAPRKMKIIMWSVLSADFDPRVTPERCVENLLRKSKAGDILLFHDSEKAFSKMKYALPIVLEEFSARGYQFRAIG